MTILLAVIYLLAALQTFRYSGNVGMITDSRHLCPREMSHRCVRCGGDVYNHRRRVLTYCDNPQYRPHLHTVLPGIAVALVWPVAVPGYFVIQASRARGKEITFFKEPPRIESKEEKMQRRLEETQAELEETNKRLKELGIDL
jgi:hypothetical protein